jgi:putative sterol carrier protein
MSAESYVYLRNLTTRDGEPIEDILKRGAKQLHNLGEQGILQFRLTDIRSRYSILLNSSGAFVHTEHVTRPTLAVITTSETFYNIAKGSYSPVQAYLDGKIKILGNVELGRRIILHLAGSGTQVRVCPWLVVDSYTPEPNPYYGVVTVTGRFFTPGGNVKVQYDWYAGDPTGGEFDYLIADSSGSFTDTAPIACGVVTTITATDLATGTHTTLAYQGSCWSPV